MKCLLCDRELHGAPAYLCPGDTAATSERLAALPGLYAALAGFLAPARRPGSSTGGTARTHAPMPVDETVLTMRGPGGIVAVLEDWRSALHEAVGWSQPVPHGTFEERVQRAAKGLGDNVLWIAGSWPAAGDFAREIRDLHRGAVSVVSPSDRGRRMGNCPTQVDGVRCGAILRLPVGGSRIACPWCGASWEPEQWVELRLEQGKFEAEPVASNPGIRVG